MASPPRLDDIATLGAITEPWTTDDELRRTDRALMRDPTFAQLYRRRQHIDLDDQRVAACPPGSLGREYLDFTTHYQLPRRFFPTDTRGEQALRPCEYAARRLTELHDFIHVLGEYETSDGDEVAIQSFVLGQAPAVFALFLRDALSSPDADGDAYVHLRQLPGRAPSRPDVARGRAAVSLLSLDIEAELGTPLAELRTRLSVQPRTTAPDPHHRNSCGGVPAGPYFAIDR